MKILVKFQKKYQRFNSINTICYLNIVSNKFVQKIPLRWTKFVFQHAFTYTHIKIIGVSNIETLT